MFHSIQNYLARSLLALGFLLAAGSAWAEAGRVLFVSGQASLVRGGTLPISKGIPVEAGDTIVTGADGRVQLLMADGDRIALRPDSRFTIDQFSGPLRSKPGQPVPGTRPSSWKSFYTLAKGGFRTLTQSFGQRDASSYQVRTPVATIGIRGTDYTLLYSEGGSSGGGELFGGVSKGEIEVKDQNGKVNSVKDNEFFQADSSGFDKLPEAPEGLNDSSENEGEGNYQEQVGESTEGEGTAEGEGAVEGEGTAEGGEEFSTRTDPIEGDGSGGDTTTTEDGTVGDLTMEFGTADTGTTDASDPPVQNITATDPGGGTVDLTGGVPPSTEHNFAIGTGPLLITSNSGGTTRYSSPSEAGSTHVPNQSFDQDIGIDGAGRLQSFQGLVDGGSTVVMIEAAGGNINDGFDLSGNTALHWGRWTGSATVTDQTNNTQIDPIDLSNISLHWIYDAHGNAVPVIPISGDYAYALIGNTDPTDNHGNVGVLSGLSTLSADFINQQVSSHIELSINSNVWEADGETATNAIGADGTFNGTYDSFNNSFPCPSCTGEFGGFFTDGSNGSTAPPGAGMTYSMEDGQGDTVSGAAAFGNPQGIVP